MNVFEYAMQMELDGKNFYDSEAEKTDVPALKNIWQQLSQDEVRHYEIFKSLRDGQIEHAAELADSGTEVLVRAKNVFEKLAAEKKNYSFGDDVIAAWDEAQKIEVQAEKFYREKSAEENDAKVKQTLELIAAEEHKHVIAIEHILQFLNEPKSTLENAEWSNLDKY